MLKSKERPTPGPTFMSDDQKGQSSDSSMSSSYSLPYTPPKASPLRKSTLVEDIRSPTPPTVQYLSELRSTRLARPSGSRPPPPSRFTSVRRADTDLVNGGPAQDDHPPLPSSNSMPNMPAPPSSHRRTDSNLSNAASRSPFAGRALARPPPLFSIKPDATAGTKPSLTRTPSVTYMESGSRWMEKQEARSLRMALEDMDLEEERKVHSAAQDEATELVWKHRNPDAAAANAEAPYANPDLRRQSRDYRSHLRKGSYQRSLSQDTASTSGQRSASDGSQHSNPDASTSSQPGAIQQPRKVSPPTGTVSVQKRRSTGGKDEDGLAKAVAKDIANAYRRTSSGGRRIMSGSRKLAMHPDDRIWEDPQEEATPPKKPQPLMEEPRPSVPTLPSYVRRNPFARVRLQHDRIERSNSAPLLPTAPLLPMAPPEDPPARLERVEIQRNPPSRSRNPWYMSNDPLPPTPPSATGRDADEVSPKVTPTKDGKEIRSDDVRAATSKSRKDYSPNLPRPTVVSDKPGRPIVSFQKDALPREVVMEEVHTAPLPRQEVGLARGSSVYGSPKPPPAFPIPSISFNDAAKPPIPTINFPDQPTIPTIVLPEEPDFATANVQSEPTTPALNVAPPEICVSGPRNASSPRSKSFQRPLPSTTRPHPHHAASSPIPQTTKSAPHYTPSIRQSGILCAHCALPIAGRVLSAAGERFHPACFVCHACHTNLECVAFYPEPEKQHHARLERIRARQFGTAATDSPDDSLDLQQHDDPADADPTPRFYCHLDFHELFSPRCKSCTTPIEGEVIMACGAAWHAGHFFCAQCGDPFDAKKPFVEKDGYAWCVGCHTQRSSAKCRGCRKAVTDVVVRALGAEWHAECFVCVECKGGFEDGRYFLRGESEEPVCVRCEERRLKA